MIARVAERMKHRFLRHLWFRGYFVALAVGLVFVVLLPTDLATKAILYITTAVLALAGAAFTYRRSGARTPPRVSAHESLQRAELTLPTSAALKTSADVRGVLTDGRHRDRHILAGWAESGFWYVVVGTVFPYRLRESKAALSHAELRENLSRAGARFLPPGEYADAVRAKYFQ